MKARRKQPRFYICVHPIGSKFAKALQQALQAKVDHKVLRTRRTRLEATFCVTTNPLNKVAQFDAFTTHNIACPKYSKRADSVGELGKHVFARTLINSTNGRGIVEFEPGVGNTPQAPLYTEYIPKKSEYRVHVFHGEVIDIQQKRKRKDFNKEQRDSRIRNVNNGYVYCRDGIDPPDGIANLAISAVNACGYEYGAVDIIYNEKRNQCYVLEVNSRPGLMGTTLDKYVNAIIKAYELKEKV